MANTEKSKRNKQERNKNEREHYKLHPEKYKARTERYIMKNPESRRNTLLKHNYGITLEDFKQLERDQNFKCAICRRAGRKLVVDHCHESGKVRGLLRKTCNQGLGLFYESPMILNGASLYLAYQGVGLSTNFSL